MKKILSLVLALALAPAGANRVLIIFSDDMCVGENTSQTCELCAFGAQRVRCGEPQPFQTRAQRSGSRLRACQKYFFDKLSGGSLGGLEIIDRADMLRDLGGGADLGNDLIERLIRHGGFVDGLRRNAG
mgnify:CR=1 FL=1